MLLLLFTREGFGELPKDISSSAEVSTSSKAMGFFPLMRTIGCLSFDHYLTCLSCQDHAFSLLGTLDDRLHATGAQRIPIIPLFVSLAPHVSSLYLDANEEIDLLAPGSLSY